MTLDTTTTRSQMADRNRNTAQTVAPAVGVNAGGQLLTFHLVFQGVQAKPEDVMDALTTKFGAAKVLGDTDTMGQGVYRLRVIP